jgi:hypothetical protein
MVIEYQNRRSNVLLALLFSLCHSRRTQFIFLGISATPGVAYLLRRYLYRGSWLLNDFIIAGVFGLGLFLALIVVSIFTTKIGKRTLSIDQDGIKTKIGSQEGVLPWKMISSIMNQNNRVLILGRKGNVFLIPSSAFTDADERTRFVKLTDQYLAEAGA